MLTLKEQAEVCRIGLIVGLLSRQDVIRWADGIIEAHPDPDYAIIEVSLNPPDMAARLFEVSGDAGRPAVTGTLLGLCAQRLQEGRLSMNEAAGILSRLDSDPSCGRCGTRVEYAVAADEETAHTAYNLACGYFLAAEGCYGSLPAAEAALTGFLKQYIAFAYDIVLERVSS
jgi:hypothetical protein